MSVPKWVPDERRLDVGRLRAQFPKLFENLQLEDQAMWQGFGQSEEDGLPVQLAKKVTPFQQVLLFQARLFFKFIPISSFHLLSSPSSWARSSQCCSSSIVVEIVFRDVITCRAYLFRLLV